MTEQELKQIFASRLREKMKEQHFNQQKLADLLFAFYGVSIQRSTISGWMNGRTMPRPILLEQVAECFGESIGEFLEPPDGASKPDSPDT